MTRTTRLTALALAALLCLILALPAAAESAGSLYKKGASAEARSDFVAAYDFYKQAFDKKPTELKYRIAYHRSRFLASSTLVSRGVALREQGKMTEALAEFGRALSVDPTMHLAQQEMKRTRERMEKLAAPPNGGAAPSGAAAPVTETAAFRERIAQAASPVELAPMSAEPITLRMTEDTKVLYESIGKLAGVNVLFDPDFTGRRLRLELNGVTVAEAVETLALQSKTFWRPVTRNTIFVAADTTAKRRELEQNVVKTFYLTNLGSATELQDVVNTFRQVLEMARIQPLPTQNAIVVRGTPDQVALAEKVISDIDRAKPEVIVEVAVMQVRRDRVREMGVKWPTTASVTLQSPTTTTTTNGTGSGTGSTTSTNNNSLTINDLGDLRASDFAVSIPSAVVNMLMTDSNSRILQNPQIRALNGAKATLKIGDRVPVATGSFQPGIGGVGINPLVNTQFNYVDVGVNIDITPTVHLNGDITLKLLLDVSSVTGRVDIGGIEQPIISQRKVEHEIRLREGEANLLGGILEEQDIRSMNGIPGLSQIPLLKYLFGSERKEQVESEIIFVLTPRTVRGFELTDQNTRAIDVGAGASGINLRRSSPAPAATPPLAGGNGTAPAGAPSGAAQPPTPASAQPMMQPPVTAAPPSATPAGEGVPPESQAPPPQAPPGGVAMAFQPPSAAPNLGGTFSMNLNLYGGQDVHTVPVGITYDPAVVQLINISSGDLLSRDGVSVALVHREDPPGTVKITASRPPSTAGITGDGTVLTLTFLAKGRGQSVIAITQPGARNRDMVAVPASGSAASVTVK